MGRVRASIHTPRPRRAAALLLACAPAPVLAAAPCRLDAAPETVVALRAIDGDTLALADGREARLAGVIAPKPPLSVPPGGVWPQAEEARAALDRAAAGRALAFRPADKPDRHGRLVGYVAAPASSDHAAVATALLEQGRLRVDASRAGRGCDATLRAAEASARRQSLGLWAHSYYEVRRAADGASFSADGRFEVAEGRVASVRTSGGRVYVNFGRRWRDALSLSISEPALRRLGGRTALGLDPGAWLRVRGVVLRGAGGPTIRIDEAAQIERIAEPGAE